MLHQCASSPKPPNSPRAAKPACAPRDAQRAYVNHLAEVANLLSAATEVWDAELVAAGWRHDAIEDTETTREELAQSFRSASPAAVSSAPIDIACPANAGGFEGSTPRTLAQRQADQIAKGEQLPRTDSARPDGGRARRSPRLHQLGRAGGRGLPRRQRLATTIRY